MSTQEPDGQTIACAFSKTSIKCRAAVLAAPLSTIMIVFELTGGYALSVALLITVSVACGLNQAVLGRSYFHRQLQMRGISLQEGAHEYFMQRAEVSTFMERLPPGRPGTHIDAGSAYLQPNTPLKTALKMFDDTGKARLPVVDPARPNVAIAFAAHVRALAYLNAELIRSAKEEHR